MISASSKRLLATRQLSQHNLALSDESPTKLTREPLDELIDAAAIGDTDQIMKLMTQETYSSVVNHNDMYELYTPLIWAAKEGHYETVDLLCGYSMVDINQSAGWVRLLHCQL